MAFREKSGIDSEDNQIRGCLISDLLSFQLSSFNFRSSLFSDFHSLHPCEFLVSFAEDHAALTRLS